MKDTVAKNSAQSEQATQVSPKYQRYAGYGVRALKAVPKTVGRVLKTVGRILLRVIDWIDRKGAFVSAVATVVIAVLTVFYVVYSRAQWTVMKESNRIIQESLRVSQRAYVTIGRKDGVAADFIVPKDPRQDIDIVIYFQNTGHLPAKFAWGTMASFKAVGSRKEFSGITLTHPFEFGLLPRTKDRKTGSIGERGESSIIAGDSVFVATIGTISQKDFEELLPNNIGLLILGSFQYCDGLGNLFARDFGLRYRSNAPSTSLSFDLANETPSLVMPVPESTATTEFLSPCETPDEYPWKH